MSNMHSRSRWKAVSVALAVPLIVFCGTAAVMSIPPNTGSIDIVRGRDLFRAHCGACHFAKEGFPAHHGPNLHDIGRTGAQRRPGMSAPQYILESIIEPAAFVAPSSRPGMPRGMGAQLDPERLRDVIGFLASCGAQPDYEAIQALIIPDRRTRRDQPVSVSRDSMEIAEKVLREQGACLECHALHSIPEGKVYAPGIFNVGLGDRQRIRQAIVEPYHEINPNYANVTIALDSGEVASGRLLSKGDSSFVLCQTDTQGNLNLVEIATDAIELDDGEPVVLPSNVSLMPAGFAEVLTPAQLDAVVTLLDQLN